MNSDSAERRPKSIEHCPHCGQKLSQWQQVLLNVDRALMCRNCWYRIILDVHEAGDDENRGAGQTPSRAK